MPWYEKKTQKKEQRHNVHVMRGTCVCLAMKTLVGRVYREGNSSAGSGGKESEPVLSGCEHIDRSSFKCSSEVWGEKGGGGGGGGGQ